MKNTTVYILTFILFLFDQSNLIASDHLYPIKKGWIKENGKEIILSYADATFLSSEGFARFTSKGKFGFINKSGFEIAKPQFDALTEFSEGIAFAKKDFKWFAIDTNGKELFSVVCNYIYTYSEGLARFQLGNKFGYINSKGSVIIPAQFAGAYSFNNGLARVYQNGKWGFIDKLGIFKIQPTYDFIWDFSYGLAAVMKKEGNLEKWGYLDISGKMVISLFEGYAFPFQDNYALIRKGNYRSGKLSIIKKDGGIESSITYTDAHLCANGLINVVKVINGVNKWGYINLNGEVVIDFKFDNYGLFYNGLALVSLDSNKVYINPKGEVIWKEV